MLSWRLAALATRLDKSASAAAHTPPATAAAKDEEEWAGHAAASSRSTMVEFARAEVEGGSAPVVVMPPAGRDAPGGRVAPVGGLADGRMGAVYEVDYGEAVPPAKRS